MSISTGAPSALARALGFQEERNGTAANATPTTPVSDVATVRNWRRPLSISSVIRLDFRSLAGLPHYTRRYTVDRRLPRHCRGFRAGCAGFRPGSRSGSRRRSRIVLLRPRVRGDAGARRRHASPKPWSRQLQPGSPPRPPPLPQFVSYADAVDATAPAVVNIYTERRVVVPNVERPAAAVRATLRRRVAGLPRARRTEPRLRRHLRRPAATSSPTSRDREGHADQGAAEGRQVARHRRRSSARIPTPTSRCCKIKPRHAAGHRARTFGQLAGRRARARDRQPDRPRPDRHAGHRQRDRPRQAGRHHVRELHPDRRRDQPRQLRRRARQRRTGELVGLNTRDRRAGRLGIEGIGFAIPVDLVRGVVDAILKDGRVVRGWIGVVPSDVTRRGYRAVRHARGLGAGAPASTRNGRPTRAGRSCPATSSRRSMASALRGAQDLIANSRDAEARPARSRLRLWRRSPAEARGSRAQRPPRGRSNARSRRRAMRSLPEPPQVVGAGHAADVRAELAQLFLDVLVAAIDVVDALDVGRALRHETREHEARRGAQVGRHDRRARQARHAAGSPPCGPRCALPRRAAAARACA